MANPIGTIAIHTTIRASETVEQLGSQKGGNWVNISTGATECPNIYYSFGTQSITYQDTGGSDDGYLNGSRFYVSATIASTAAVTGLSDVEFICFKHTGFRYSSSSVLGVANTTDHLCIRGGAVDGFVIAVLGPGAGIALPVQSPSSGWPVADEVDSADYFVQSVDTLDLTPGAQTIALEFICVTHS